MQVVGNLFAAAALVLLEVGLYQISKDVAPGLEMAIFLLGIVFVFSKLKKETRKNKPYKVMFYSALPVVGLLLLAVVHYFVQFEIFSQKFISLAVIAVYFAAAIQLVTDFSDMLEKGTYESCINKISGTTVRGKNK